MKKPDDLNNRIEDSTRTLSADYETALHTIRELKNKMLLLEQEISEKKPEETNKDKQSLAVAIDNLDKLTESMILKSKDAWKRYEELKSDCKAEDLDSIEIKEFRTMCKKTEQLAADLLCYSLGLLKHRSR